MPYIRVLTNVQLLQKGGPSIGKHTSQKQVLDSVLYPGDGEGDDLGDRG